MKHIVFYELTSLKSEFTDIISTLTSIFVRYALHMPRLHVLAGLILATQNRIIMHHICKV